MNTTQSSQPTGSAGAPANRGLLDQVAALHWVQDNIAADAILGPAAAPRAGVKPVGAAGVYEACGRSSAGPHGIGGIANDPGR